MNGIKYLLDTNIIGLLKGHKESLFLLEGVDIAACGYSTITRMELLGFHGITTEEECAISDLLEQMTYLSLEPTIENTAIRIRRQYRLKLPSAIITATAKTYGLDLLTLDKKLALNVEQLTSL